MNLAQLDVERFQKVRKLLTEGATPGERMAARSRADAIAKAAGLDFRKACAKADAAKVHTARPSPSLDPNWTDAFRDIFNTPEMRAQRAEREKKRQDRVRELLNEYGSEEAVFRQCDKEQALDRACRPFRVVRETTGWRIGSLSGWDGDRVLPVTVRDAIIAAVALPADVVGLWAEYDYWLRRGDDRCAFYPDADDPICIRARLNVLERRLDTSPARSFPDLLARVAWMQHVNERGFRRSMDEDGEMLDTLRGDIDRMAKTTIVSDLDSAVGDGMSVQGGQIVEPPNLGAEGKTSGFSPDPVKTTSDRRRIILSMLDDPETSGLKDREIARRVGVSPTTVGNLRRRRAAR